MALHLLTSRLGPWAVLLCGTVCLAQSPAPAGPSAEGVEFFETKIRPLLSEQCYKCHSAQAEKGIKGGFSLETREGLLRGGDSGPAIVPGSPDESRLVRAVR